MCPRFAPCPQVVRNQAMGKQLDKKVIAMCLLPTAYGPLPQRAHYSLPLLLIAYRLLPTAHCLLPVVPAGDCT
jgi:hypothetical protein